MTRDHHLPRRVEIDRLGNLIAGRLATGIDQGGVIEPDDGGHTTLSIGNGITHDLAAETYEIDRLGKLEHARRDQRRELTQTVPCDPSWISATDGAPDAPRRHTRHQHQWLGDFGERKTLRWTLLRELPQIETEHLGSGVETLAHLRMIGGQIGHHADRLGSLTREQEDAAHAGHYNERTDHESVIPVCYDRPSVLRELYVRTTQPSTTLRRAERGFTLIEIMVVVVIIGLLAAFIVPRVMGRVDEARITKVKADIQAIETALSMYKLDTARYPTTVQGLQALVQKPDDPSLTNWKVGGYIARVSKDPWGNDYQYQFPGTRGREFDLYSFGPDGVPGDVAGGGDDIGNWNLGN